MKRFAVYNSVQRYLFNDTKFDRLEYTLSNIASKHYPNHYLNPNPNPSGKCLSHISGSKHPILKRFPVYNCIPKYLSNDTKFDRLECTLSNIASKHYPYPYLNPKLTLAVSA